MMIGTSTTSFQFHRCFSCVFKSWYFFYYYFIISCSLRLTRWSNGQAISIIVQLLSLLSTTTTSGPIVTCIFLIPPLALAHDHTTSFGSSQNSTFGKVSSKHIYQPDRVSSLCIPSELVSFTLSPCD